MTECTNEDCGMFPHYGAAPHECFWRKPGGFEGNALGTSTILQMDKWPDNFLAEIDPDTPVTLQLSWGLCGVYYCPDCLKGYHVSDVLWDKKKISDALLEGVE